MIVLSKVNIKQLLLASHLQIRVVIFINFNTASPKISAINRES